MFAKVLSGTLTAKLIRSITHEKAGIDLFDLSDLYGSQDRQSMTPTILARRFIIESSHLVLLFTTLANKRD